MSLFGPTVPELPGGLTVVVGSPACMSRPGMIGLPCLSFAKAGKPLAVHGRALFVRGVKFKSFAAPETAWALDPNVNAVRAAAPTAPVMRTRADRRFF